MTDFYRPYKLREPDSQYRDNLRKILEWGELIKDTPQGSGAYTCFGTLPAMIFDLANGFPLITERSLKGFWRKPIAEIIAFINGARTLDEIASYGCDYWEKYRGEGTQIGLDPDDMGPGSYGPAFAAFERPDGGVVNQFELLLQQMRDYPTLRTFVVSPWKPYYTARGPNRKVLVAPCHGWLQFRIINGRLDMIMTQRSADMPIGVPSNMAQYAALLLMICQVTGYTPGRYVHQLNDAHIYENQVEQVRQLLDEERLPRYFPTLRLNPEPKDLFAFRKEDFILEDYNPHPPLKIEFTA